MTLLPSTPLRGLNMTLIISNSPNCHSIPPTSLEREKTHTRQHWLAVSIVYPCRSYHFKLSEEAVLAELLVKIIQTKSSSHIFIATIFLDLGIQRRVPQKVQGQIEPMAE